MTLILRIDISSMKIKVAEYSLVSPDTDEQWIPVASVKIPPSFNLTNIVHDLALVQVCKFKMTFKFGSH